MWASDRGRHCVRVGNCCVLLCSKRDRERERGGGSSGESRMRELALNWFSFCCFYCYFRRRRRASFCAAHVSLSLTVLLSRALSQIDCAAQRVRVCVCVSVGPAPWPSYKRRMHYISSASSSSLQKYYLRILQKCNSNKINNKNTCILMSGYGNTIILIKDHFLYLL